MEYLFTPGGAHKANRMIVEGLTTLGFECRVISGGSEPGDRGIAKVRQQLVDLGLPSGESMGGAVSFTLNGVRVEVVTDALRMFAMIRHHVRTMDPDVTVVSEDPSLLMLQTAADAGARHTVYLAHSQATLPLGPAAFESSPQRTRILAGADGIITVSRFVADYIKNHVGMASTVIYSPVYGRPEWPDFGAANQGLITMINPSRIKGLDIFLELARRLPHLPFAAVPTWATSREDREALEKAGITIVPPSDCIDDIFAQTRILLVPSLWGEAFGQIVVEAMLRGIPVLASDLGGLPEAKLGVDYLLPVREIEAYEDRYNECNVRVPIIPDQDVRPWEETLARITEDVDLYARVSRQSLDAARNFAAQSGFAPYTAFLEGIVRAEPGPEANPARDRSERMRRLTPEQRALLARRLHAKAPVASTKTP